MSGFDDERPWPSAFLQLVATQRCLLNQFEQRLGHTLPRWRIMLALYREGTLSQKQLIAQLGSDPAALTRQIQALERHGWVARHSDPQDNRLTNVVLTPAGRAEMTASMPRRAQFLDEALGILDEADMQTLETLLQRLEQGLRARVQ